MLSTIFAHFLLLAAVLGRVPGSGVGLVETISLDLLPLMVLPEPEITVNHSTNYVDGLEWHYRIPDPETGEIIEEFSIHIIDGGLIPAAEESLPRRSPTELVSLQPRDNWICEWIYACVGQATYQAGLSAAQISAAASALGRDLSANGYAKAKSIAGGFLYQNAIGVISGVASFYLTNHFQGQDTKAKDTCSSVDINNLANTVRQLQEDLRDLGKWIQAGDSRQRGYEHRSTETRRKIDGAHLKHTCKPTKDPKDYYKISDCHID